MFVKKFRYFNKLFFFSSSVIKGITSRPRNDNEEKEGNQFQSAFDQIKFFNDKIPGK